MGLPAALSAMTFITSSITNAQVGTGAGTITAPSGIQAGDLLVLLNSHAATGTTTAVAPSGWTLAVSQAATNVSMAISYKIAAGTESGTTVSGMNGGTAVKNLVMLVFRGSKAVSTVTVGSTHTQEVDTDPTAQVCAASGGVAPLIVLGAYSNAASGTDINPRTFTVGGVAAKDGEINSNTDNYLAYKIFNSAPADCTIDMQDHGTQNFLQSCYLQLT